jgi:hypothetical protein
MALRVQVARRAYEIINGWRPAPGAGTPNAHPQGDH